MKFNLGVITQGGSGTEVHMILYLFLSQVCQLFSLCDISLLSIILSSWSYHPNPSFISSQVGLCSNILPDHLISCHFFALVPSFIPQHIDLYKTLCHYLNKSLFLIGFLLPKDRLYFFFRKVTCLTTLFTYKTRWFTEFCDLGV